MTSSRLGVRLILALLRDAFSAVRASIVLAEPSTNTLMVEPVLARKDGDLLADVDFVHANTTLGLVFCSEHLLVHLLTG